MYQGGLRRRQGSGDGNVPVGKSLNIEGTLTLGATGALSVDPAATWPGFRVAVVDLIAVTTSTPGGLISWPNPVAGAILLFRPVLRLATEATGAATADIGVAANGTTTSDTLFDGVDIGSAAGLFEAGVGTNGKPVATMAAGTFITGTASATAAGLVGQLVIPYVTL